MRHRKLEKAVRRWLSVIGRLALIVSIWHAPLPMLHAHDADVHDPVAAETFVHHLAEYHPEVPLNSHFDFGWHWHLVPPPATHPSDDSHHGDCPSCPQDQPETVLQLQASASILQSVCAWSAAVWVGPLTAPATSSQLAQATTHQFLDTYLGSVSLGTLLRVARC
jgi:hypothetical protein